MRSLIPLLVVLLPELIFSQSIRLQGAIAHFAQYQQTEGLSQNSINALSPQAKGFLWIATEDGLNGFDGYGFRILRNKPGQANSLCWNNVSSVAYDQATGLLWAGTIKKGVSVYRQLTDSFTHIDLSVTAKNSNEWVQAIAFSGAAAWIGTDSGFVLADRYNLTVKKTQYTGKIVQRLVPINEGVLVFFKNGEAWQEDTNGRILAKMQILPSGIEINDVQKAGDRIFLGTTGGLFAWKPGTQLAVRQTVRTAGQDYSGNSMTCCLVDSKKRQWLGLAGIGLLLRSEKDSAFTLIRYNAAQRHSLTDNAITSIVEDDAKNIWIGTQKGLNRLLKYPAWLQSFTTDEPEYGALFNRVQAIYSADNNQVFFGGKSGLFLLNKTTHVVQKLSIDSAQLHQRFYFIRPLTAEQWLVSSYAGVQVLQKKGNAYVLDYSKQYPELDSFKRKRITAVVKLSDHDYLFSGIEAGCWLWNVHTKKVVPVTNPEGDFKKRYNVYHLLRQGDSVWIATNKGLFLWKMGAATINPFPLRHPALSAQPHINSLAWDDGRLWMAFTSEGVGCLNLVTRALNVYNTDNGLRNNISYSIVADPYHRIWVSGVEGAALILPRENRILYYNRNDGLQDNEFTNFSYWQRDQELYLGGPNGFSVIDTRAYRHMEELPAVMLSRVQVLKGSNFVPWDQWSNLSFSHDQNSLNFFVAFTDVGVQHRLEYLYRLLPVRNRWINNGRLNSLSFTNLPPGSYTLELAPGSEEGLKEAPITRIPFSVVPAWYQTTLFKLLVVALALLFLYLLVRWYYLARLRKQRMEYEKLLAVQQERQRISSEIHDDIGAGLSGVRLLSEMASNKIHDQEMKEEVSRIHSSIADLSGKMREVIWSLNVDNDTLENLVYYMRRQAEQLFEGSPIRLTVTLPEAIPDKELTGEKRRHIFLAVKEALHNCLKHSGAQCCTLHMDVKNHHLLVVIKDNGRGMQGAQNEFGNGMRTMRQRMEAVDGILRIGNNNGTQIEFLIPVV